MKKINIAILVLFISFGGFSQDIITTTSGFKKANNSDFGVPTKMFAGSSKYLYVLTDDINAMIGSKKEGSKKHMHLQSISKSTMKTEKSVRIFGQNSQRDKLLKGYRVHQVFSVGEYVHIIWRNLKDLEYSIYVESFSLDLKTRSLPKLVYNNASAIKQQKTDNAKIIDFKFFTEEGQDIVVGAMEIARGDEPMVVQFFVLNNEMEIESVQSNTIPIKPRTYGGYVPSSSFGKYHFSKKGILYCSFEVSEENDNQDNPYFNYGKEVKTFFLISRFDGKKNEFDYFVHRKKGVTYTMNFFDDEKGTRCIGTFRDHNLMDGILTSSHGIYLADFDQRDENLVLTKQHVFSDREYEELFGVKRKKFAINKKGEYVDYSYQGVSLNFSEIQVDPKTSEISWLSNRRSLGFVVANKITKMTKYKDYTVDFFYFNFNEKKKDLICKPFSHNYGKVKSDHPINSEMVSLIKDGKRVIFFDVPDIRKNASGKKSYFTDYIILNRDGNGKIYSEEYLSDNNYQRTKLDVRNMFVQNNTLYTFGVNKKRIIWAKLILYPTMITAFPIGIVGMLMNQHTITDKYYYGYSKIEGDVILEE